MQNNTLLKDNFSQRVLQAVYNIPYGKVATYGAIARMAGSSRAARQVGNVLKRLPEGSLIPWYRVVNRYGKISLIEEDYQRQYQALIAEGIVFQCDGSIDLQRFGWPYY